MAGRRGATGTRTTGWVGWIAFGAAMLMVVGFFNLVNGLAAVFEDEIFIEGDRGSLVLDLTAWGWVHVGFGALMILTGLALMSGAFWARVVASLLITINMATQVLVLPAYPLWAILIIALDVLVLWAILVHGEETKAL